MKRYMIVLFALLFASQAQGTGSRIKDIGHIGGVRGNTLTGLGLVIGLNKTGDKSVVAQQEIRSILERFGIAVAGTLKAENTAAVMVTAELPPFERPGSKIDVTVSSIGDAQSLQGGILLPTSLLGLDGNVYAIAQGSLVLGGFSAGSATTSITVNHPTVGRIPNGGSVERAVVTGLSESVESMELILDRVDFTSTKRAVDAINAAFGRAIAQPLDGKSVRLSLPVEYRSRPVDFIATVEMISVETDSRARVIVNERTGTVVIGADVTLAPVSISHGNLSIQIETKLEVSQPQAFGQGQTVVVPNETVTAQEQKSNFVTLNRGATVDDLIHSLNALGVTPRDTVAILEALKAAGALRAELEVL